MARPFGVSNGPSGRREGSTGRCPDGRSDAILPGEYARNRLATARSGRCYPHRALGAGTLAGQALGTVRSRVLERRPADADDPPSPSFADPRDPASARLVRRPIHPHSSLDRDIIDRMDAKQVWRAALGELQVSLSPANFETWLRDTQLVDVDEQRFRIAVPNGFAKDWLENRYRSLISQTLARIVGYSVQVEFTIVPARRPPRDADGTARPPAGRGRRPRSGSSRRGSAARAGSANLNPRYTFANFIVGSANRLAHAATPVGRRAAGPRLQPALPVRRGRPRQDPPDARDRQPGDRQVPAQARRLRDEREVHERVHHLDPAGQDRRVPGPLPADRPAPDRRHPVHRRQGADPGRVLPHVQRDPRGRQADRPVVGPAAEGDPHARGAAADRASSGA